MRRTVLGLVPALALLAITTVAIAGSAPVTTTPTRVSVRPATGSQHTKFRLSFRIPEATGKFGLLARSDVISISGPSGRRCASPDTTRALRSAKRGARFRLTLDPRRGEWCVGAFRGRIVESQRVICLPHQACPDIEIAPRTIASFKFRVKRSPGSGSGGGTGGGGTGGGGTGTQTTGPTFAGLISATTCRVLIPKVQPQAVSYQLTWQAASDPVTPSSQIVYDIYMTTSQGGENYATPNWTTSAGLTSYATPGLDPAGGHYFVVRARDAAGLEDHNTVERAGVSVCA